jgi:hypothetical protein
MSKYSSYRYGESAVMPQGEPFILAIEGVDTKFELVHHLDAAGNIHMSVDRAGQTSRRPMHDARRAPHVIHDEGDDDAIDPLTGLIRDGHGIRVPLQLADAKPLIITTGIDWGRDDFNRDGTLKRRNHRDDDPQSRRRRKVQARDPMGREAGTYEEQTDDHRPGHRFGDAAGRAVVDAAYNAMVTDLTNAWRTPQNNQQAADPFFDAAPPAGVSASAWARELNMRETRDAWMKPPPPVTDGVGLEVAPYSVTRAAPNRPKDAWGPAGYAAKPGDPCMTNAGEAGVLRQEGDWLYCQITPLGPTRATPTNRNADSMTADQAQVIRTQAYQQYCSDLENAWRS